MVETLALNVYDLNSTSHSEINNLRSSAQSGLPSDTFGIPIKFCGDIMKSLQIRVKTNVY